MTEPNNTNHDFIQGNGSKIIKNSSILQEEYKPPFIKERDMLMKSVDAHLKEALRNDSFAANGIFWGPAGVGKTLVTTLAIEKFIEQSNAVGKKYRYVIIDCLGRPGTLTHKYRRILQSINPDCPQENAGETTLEFQEKISSILKESNTSLIVVLDNIDAVNPSHLYDLTRTWRKNLHSNQINVGFIGLTRKPIFTILDSKSNSIIDFNHFEFPAYTKSELESILRDRLNAFHDGSFDEEVIQAVAIPAVRVKGDARQAIDLMRKAAEYAQSMNKTSVSLDDVKFINDMEVKAQSDTIPMGLTNSMIPLFLAILFSRELFHVHEFRNYDLYKCYCDICSKNQTKHVGLPWFSGLVTGLGKKQYITTSKVCKGKYGNTRLIRLNLDNEKILRILHDLKPEGTYLKDLIAGLIEAITEREEQNPVSSNRASDSATTVNA
jgi:archaeal cell division control protein 6